MRVDGGFGFLYGSESGGGICFRHCVLGLRDEDRCSSAESGVWAAVASGISGEESQSRGQGGKRVEERVGRCLDGGRDSVGKGERLEQNVDRWDFLPWVWKENTYPSLYLLYERKNVKNFDLMGKIFVFFVMSWLIIDTFPSSMVRERPRPSHI
jgi:hypothetical protein